MQRAIFCIIEIMTIEQNAIRHKMRIHSQQNKHPQAAADIQKIKETTPKRIHAKLR